MKGIILAGGSGTRLYPMTAVSSKQLLPIYDKPMVYYPISSILRAGVSEILIISSPKDLPSYSELLGDGSNLGVELSYLEQERPAGLAQALTIGEEFLDSEECVLILGDNLFHGISFGDQIKAAAESVCRDGGAHLFGKLVHDPERFGVASVDEDGRILEIVEKPRNPQSRIAVTGLYMFDSEAPMRARTLQPSDRGELEITDLNMTYVNDGSARISVFDDSVVWLDTGTPKSLLSASEFVSGVQESGNEMVGCVEEVAFEEGLIGKKEIEAIASDIPEGNKYGAYLRRLVRE